MKKRQKHPARGAVPPERLKQRIESWLAGGGEAEFDRTMKAAEQACESFRASIRVDPKTLDEPVTL